MGTVALSGSITAGPAGSGAFPTSVLTAQLALSTLNKSFNQGTGILRRAISSPAAFVALEGTPGTVPQANLLYLRSDAPVQVRMTFDDAPNPDIVSVVPVKGPLVMELEDARFLKLLEVQGTANIEYMLTGN